MCKIINLTPHTITINIDGTEIDIQPSGVVARVSQKYTNIGTVDHGDILIPVASVSFGPVHNVPELQLDGAGNPKKYYLVSGIVKQALPDRMDVLSPDTGPSCLRGMDGRIKAVRRLVQRMR